MIDIVGWELDRALARLAEEGIPEPDLERILPPRGAPYPAGVWRVVRAEIPRGRLTAALFPFAREPEDENGAERETPPEPPHARP